MSLRFRVLAVPLAVLLASAPLVPGVGNAAGSARCTNDRLPVTLSDAGPTYRIHLTVCRPTRHDGVRTADVFVDGATYTDYWEWDVRGFSVAQRTQRAGRTAITYDPIGRGLSDKPAHPVLPGVIWSTPVTLEAEARILDQVVAYAHYTGHRRVNTVGHSHGSGVAIHQAVHGRSPVHRLALTGYLHGQRNTEVSTRNEPASNQPDLFPGYDAGWFTSKRGAENRGLSFYHTIEQWKLDLDEQRKSVVSGDSLGGYAREQGAAPEFNIARQLHQPVLLQVGRYDSIFCRPPSPNNCDNRWSLWRSERAYFANARALAVDVVDGAGHSITLDEQAGVAWRALNNFLGVDDTRN